MCNRVTSFSFTLFGFRNATPPPVRFKAWLERGELAKINLSSGFRNCVSCDKQELQSAKRAIWGAPKVCLAENPVTRAWGPSFLWVRIDSFTFDGLLRALCPLE